MIILTAKDGKPSVRSLGAGNCPASSPDDEQIAFLVWPHADEGSNSGVWVMNADGSKRRHLTSFVGAPTGRPTEIGS